MDGAPTASQLLEVWERGRFQPPAERARLLLALAAPAAPPAELDGLGIGRRDQALLELRERIFGPRLTGLAQCPACAREVELDFGAADVRAPAAGDAAAPQTLRLDGYEVRFRLPTGEDLAAVGALGDPPGARAALLGRCVTGVLLRGEPASGDALPEAVAVAISERMAALDPQGDIRLELRCPDCGHRWQAPLDVVSYLWSEVHAWAARMLRDVHALAAAYGWGEADILAMGPARRNAYLELVRQ